jgi:hypothetical protein
VTLKLPVIDLSRLAEEQREKQLAQISEEDARRTFDLETPPLLRVKLVRLAEDRHVLLVTMHHLITDQWSMGVFRHELAMLYEAFGQRAPSPLSDLPFQFSDFVRWQHKVLSGGLLNRHVAYWRQQLNDPSPRLEFRAPARRAKPARFHSTRKPLDIADDLFERIKSFAARENCTPFMVFVAALDVLIYRHTGQSDIRIGTLVANRNQPGTERLIGYMVNAVVLRTKVAPAMACRELLQSVRKVCLSGYTHQELPFEYLESLLERRGKGSKAPIYQVMLNYRGVSTAPQQVHGLTIAPWNAKNRAPDPGIAISRLDINLNLRELPTRLTGAVNYRTDVFTEAEFEKFLGNFSAVLGQMVNDAERPITEIQLG